MEWPFGSARARQFGLSILFLLLLAQPSYTQPFPESSRQKAEEERKKQETKGTDEAYKALMKLHQGFVGLIGALRFLLLALLLGLLARRLGERLSVRRLREQQQEEYRQTELSRSGGPKGPFHLLFQFR